MSEIGYSYKNKMYQEEVARAVRELFALGYVPYDGFGEMSVRDAETGNVFISIEPGQFHIRTPEDYHGCDIVIVDADGNPLTDYTKPSKALPLHLAIYKARPDVNAIVHSKSQWVCPFAEKGQGIPFILEEQVDLGGTTKCVTTPPSDSDAYYADVVRTLGKKKTVIMKDNGVVSVAENIDRCVNYFAWIEAVCRKATRASLIGKVNVIKHDDPDFQL